MSAGDGGRWQESFCRSLPSRAGGLTQIPCYSYSHNSPSDFTQNQTVVWHHLCLLHNQDIFSGKLLISLSKQVLSFHTLKGNKQAVSWKGCRFVYGSHQQDSGQGAPQLRWRNGSLEVVVPCQVRQSGSLRKNGICLCLPYGSQRGPWYLIVLWRTVAIELKKWDLQSEETIHFESIYFFGFWPTGRMLGGPPQFYGGA